MINIEHHLFLLCFPPRRANVFTSLHNMTFVIVWAGENHLIRSVWSVQIYKMISEVGNLLQEDGGPPIRRRHYIVFLLIPIFKVQIKEVGEEQGMVVHPYKDNLTYCSPLSYHMSRT